MMGLTMAIIGATSLMITKLSQLNHSLRQLVEKQEKYTPLLENTQANILITIHTLWFFATLYVVFKGY
jgi:hypothetical protein